MRISSVRIFNLFGIFNHNIPLNLKERITIIHGPNGVGKTTVLQLISDIFSKRVEKIRSQNFEKIIITFKREGKLTISRNIAKENSATLNFKYTFKDINNSFTYKFNEQDSRIRRYPLSVIDDLIPSLNRISPKEWHDKSTNQILSLDEVLLRFSDYLPYDFTDKSVIPQWLDDILTNISVHFIQTQRLLVLPVYDKYKRQSSRESHITAVEKYSERMSNQIEETLKQSGLLSASLDRAFPQKVIQGDTASIYNEGKIRRLYEEQTEYRDRLMACGLLDTEEQMELPNITLDNEKLSILSLYFTDVKQKLSIFDELLSKIELFKDIINTRFLYKDFNVNKDRGFVFKTKKGEPIPLNSLSSGEQHELVLAYQLIFDVKPETLVLVDEPELSLHVIWQRKFLEDIKRISKLANLEFLVATHSPSIIHDQRDLMVVLSD